MKNGVSICRKCGKPVAEITWGAFRKSIVDADAVWVVADAHGEDYVRIDGSKVKAVVAETGTIGAEPAYRQHRKTCGVGT
jgi:hypothetical protein